MSFWEDASGGVKGAIVVGIVAILSFGVMYFAGIGIYAPATDDELSEDRGLPPPPGG